MSQADEIKLLVNEAISHGDNAQLLAHRAKMEIDQATGAIMNIGIYKGPNGLRGALQETQDTRDLFEKIQSQIANMVQELADYRNRL